MPAWSCCWSNNGGLPLSSPAGFERGVFINVIQLRKQSAKRDIIEVREHYVFVCTGEVDPSDQNGLMYSYSI